MSEKKPRQLGDVIDEMVGVIPTEEEEFIAQLKDNKESVLFSAPELIGNWWNIVSSSIREYVPDIPTEMWHCKVLSIFSTVPIDQIIAESKLV